MRFLGGFKATAVIWKFLQSGGLGAGFGRLTSRGGHLGIGGLGAGFAGLQPEVGIWEFSQRVSWGWLGTVEARGSHSELT